MVLTRGMNEETQIIEPGTQERSEAWNYKFGHHQCVDVW